MSRRFTLIAGLIAGTLLTGCAREQLRPAPDHPRPAVEPSAELTYAAAPLTEEPSIPLEKMRQSPGLPQAEAEDSEAGVRIELLGPVPEHDRRLVEFGLELAKPLFEAHDIPMRATVYVVGDEEILFSSEQFPEWTEEDRDIVLGKANPWEGRVMINISFINRLSEGGSGRDIILLRTVVHEMYHMLQSDLSGERDWEIYDSEVPLFLREGSAYVAEWRGLLGWFCPGVPRVLETAYGEPFFAELAASPREKGCNPELLQRNVLFASIDARLDLRHRYLIEEFGLEAYDRYFEAFTEETWRSNGLPPWEAAFQHAFGMSWEEFKDRAFFRQPKTECADCELLERVR